MSYGSTAVPASSAIARRDGRFLLVLRRNPPSEEMYAFPGGRAELGETPAEAAVRELFEETGIVGSNPFLFETYDLIEQTEDGQIASHYFLSVFTVDVDNETVASAADDAVEVGWYTLEEIRILPVPESVLECVETLSRRR